MRLPLSHGRHQHDPLSQTHCHLCFIVKHLWQSLTGFNWEISTCRPLFFYQDQFEFLFAINLCVWFLGSHQPVLPRGGYMRSPSWTRCSKVESPRERKHHSDSDTAEPLMKLERPKQPWDLAWKWWTTEKENPELDTQPELLHKTDNVPWCFQIQAELWTLCPKDLKMCNIHTLLLSPSLRHTQIHAIVVFFLAKSF